METVCVNRPLEYCSAMKPNFVHIATDITRSFVMKKIFISYATLWRKVMCELIEHIRQRLGLASLKSPKIFCQYLIFKVREVGVTVGLDRFEKDIIDH